MTDREHPTRHPKLQAILDEAAANSGKSLEEVQDQLDESFPNAPDLGEMGAIQIGIGESGNVILEFAAENPLEVVGDHAQMALAPDDARRLGMMLIETADLSDKVTRSDGRK